MNQLQLMEKGTRKKFDTTLIPASVRQALEARLTKINNSIRELKIERKEINDFLNGTVYEEPLPF